MAQLNYKKIEKIINTFIHENIDEELVVKKGVDFDYYYGSDVITYTLTENKRMDKLFMDFSIEEGLTVNCSVFLLSLFHEIGHYMTFDDLEEEDFAYSCDVKALLGTTDDDVKIYFRLPIEIAATEWAINYINEHPTEISTLEKAINKLF